MSKRILLALLLSLSCYALTYANTFYSKVNVTVSTGEGYVYASKSNDVDVSSINSESHSATNSTYVNSQSATSTTHTYYLFAKAKDEHSAFKCWDDNDVSNPRTVSVKATSTSSSNPTEVSYSAIFESTILTVGVNEPSLGSVSIDKPINSIGDEVTVTASVFKPKGNGEFGSSTHSVQSIVFDGWYDESGNKLSDEKTLKYTVKGQETLKAYFHKDLKIKTDENGNIYGYYRLRTPYGGDNTNYFLCLTGNFQPNISYGDRYLTGAVEFNQQPYDYNMVYSHNYANSPAVFSDAGSVLYITGKADLAKIETFESRVKIATDIVAYAQGVSTAYITDNQALSVMTGATPGCYILYTTMAGQTLSLQLNYWNHIWITKDKPGVEYYDFNGDLEILPIDEEHVDLNYFGAYPDKTMEYDGGYWTSMYTSFPYKCYEPDGVEAYVANSVYSDDGINYIVINRLESGIVPAATPVLLKCKGLNPKENRLIPLMPDDARLSSAAAEVGENILTGEYGLWTGGEFTNNHSVFEGRKPYEETMRVFSVNGEGTLGFYKLAANADGTAQELVPNRAYLDISKLPDAANGPLRIVDSRYIDMSGIENVGVDANSGDDRIFDIYGRRVKEMTSGNIYIRNGRKILYK